MLFFPAEHFIITSYLPFKQNLGRFEANLEEDLFTKIFPFKGSKYVADDTYYFRFAPKGRAGRSAPAIKSIIKENKDKLTCQIFFRVRLSAANWSFLILITMILLLFILCGYYILPIIFWVALYGTNLKIFADEVKRIKEKLNTVFQSRSVGSLLDN